MKKKDKVTIGIVCFALLLTGAVLLTTGKKSENKTENGNVVLDEDVLFEGLGNNQGNAENGGEQTWLDMWGILCLNCHWMIRKAGWCFLIHPMGL